MTGPTRVYGLGAQRALVALRWAPSSFSLVAVLLFGSSIPARAQENPLPFHGWALLGGGVGFANIACGGDGCTSGWKLRGPIFLLSAGVMLNPHLGVGAGLDVWWRSPLDTEATNTGTLFLRYYPSVRVGAFLEGGAGLSRASVRLHGDTIAQGRRWAVMGAVGYDVRLLTVNGADITLTPRVSYVSSSIGALKYAAGSTLFAAGWRHQVLSFGLAVAAVGPRARR